jgi:hypothetical protein
VLGCSNRSSKCLDRARTCLSLQRPNVGWHLFPSVEKKTEAGHAEATELHRLITELYGE